MISMEVTEFLSPKTIEEAYKLSKEPNNIIIGGGAWLKLSLKKARLEKIDFQKARQTLEKFEFKTLVKKIPGAGKDIEKKPQDSQMKLLWKLP